MAELDVVACRGGLVSFHPEMDLFQFSFVNFLVGINRIEIGIAIGFGIGIQIERICHLVREESSAYGFDFDPEERKSQHRQKFHLRTGNLIFLNPKIFGSLPFRVELDFYQIRNFS